MKYAADDCRYTHEQVRRVACIRGGASALPATDIHKASVLAASRFWVEVVDDVAALRTLSTAPC